MVKLAKPAKLSGQWGKIAFKWVIFFICLLLGAEVLTRAALRSLQFKQPTAVSSRNSAEIWTEEHPLNAVSEGNEIVILGVEPGAFWPNQLHDITQKSIGALSRSDAGIIQSLVRLDEAVRVKPSKIILPLYVNEDLLGTYREVYQKSMGDRWKTSDPARLELIREQEEKNELSRQIALVTEQVNKYQRQAAGTWRGPAPEWLKPLLDSSRFLNLCWNLNNRVIAYDQNELWRRIRALPNADQLFVFLDLGFEKAVMAPSLHLPGLRRQDPRVAEGLRIITEAVRELREKCFQHNVELSVMLIPSKESVYRSYLSRLGTSKASVDYQDLIYQEELIRKNLLQVFTEQGIPAMDALTELQNALKGGVSIYQMEATRLNREGQLALGEAAAVLLHKKSAGGLAAKDLFAEREPEIVRGPRFKLMAWVAFVAVILIFLGTRIDAVARPVGLLALFTGYLIFQSLFSIEFFPMTSFQAYAYPSSGNVQYFKMMAVREDGSEFEVGQKVLPFFSKANVASFYAKLLSQPDLAHRMALVVSDWYKKQTGDSPTKQVLSVRFEKWKWDVMGDPYDPNRGFAAARATGKIFEEE